MSYTQSTDQSSGYAIMVWAFMYVLLIEQIEVWVHIQPQIFMLIFYSILLTAATSFEKPFLSAGVKNLGKRKVSLVKRHPPT